MSLEIKSLFNETSGQWDIHLNGEIDVYTADKLKLELSNVTKDKKENIKIDGENLQYIDSTGLGVLIGVYKNINEEGKQLTLKNIKPNIKKLFVITGLDKIFNIEE